MRIAVITVILVLFVTASSNVAANQTPPPFTVEATLTKHSFRPDQAGPPSSLEAGVIFQFSNNWWQVDVTYHNPAKNRPLRQNCMKIPDGERHYSIFESRGDGAVPSASVCPMGFPPPGYTFLFVPWLALFPNPQMTEIDSRHMRRFPNELGCAQTIFEHKQNLGEFEIDYLGQERVFLSRLMITNNGINLTQEEGIMPYPAPFDVGFLELEYSVLESTNINGFEFPLLSLFRRFGPMPSSQSREDIFAYEVAEFQVKRISFSAAEYSSDPRLTAPSLLALDERPAILPKGRSADYMVTNDQWLPVSDRKIVTLAKISSMSDKVKRSRPAFWLRLTFMIVLLGAPIGYFLVRLLLQPKHKQQAKNIN